MNINHVENIYRANGLNDYKLTTVEDLLRVHGIDFRDVEGYKRLDDINKQLYSKFIVNIFNAHGIEARTCLVPKGIYYVEDREYLVKESLEDDYFTCVGGIVKSIDKNGIKTVLHNLLFEKYKSFEIIEADPENYLRFEYEYQGIKKWLHVVKENTWY